MSFIKPKFYIPKNDLHFMSSSEINIDWVKQCLYSKKNKRNCILTFIVWYACLLLFAPATLLARGLVWNVRPSLLDYQELPLWVRYVALAYVLVDILFIFLVFFLFASEKSINHFSIIKLLMTLGAYLEEIDSPIKGTTFIWGRSLFNRKSENISDIVNAMKLLHVKKSIRYIEENGVSDKCLKDISISINTVILLILTLIQGVMTIIFLVCPPILRSI